MDRRRRACGTVPLVMVVALAGCAETAIEPEQAAGIANLPRPSVVLVHKFGVNVSEVTATQGLYGKAIDAAEQETTSQEAADLAQDVSNGVTDELVKKIGGMGLTARRAPLDAAVPGNALIITGHFVDVDAGNKAQQLVIGLGFGQAKMDTEVQVLSPSTGGYRTLLEFKTHADSGEMPGAAITMGAGAAAQGGLTAGMAAANVAVTGVKAYRTAMGPMASRTADKSAAYLGKFFASQGWISPDKVPLTLP